MFLLISEYIKSVEEIDRLLDSHKQFLKKYYEDGLFICSGRKNPRTGGLIICRAKSREEAQAILSEDPFFIEQAAKYEIIEILPTMYQDGFERFLQCFFCKEYHRDGISGM